MKKKTFINKLDKAIKKLNQKSGKIFTCRLIGYKNDVLADDYRQFINIHLGHSKFKLSNYNVDLSYKGILIRRYLILEAFKQEVLSTKRYLKY